MNWRQGVNTRGDLCCGRPERYAKRQTISQFSSFYLCPLLPANIRNVPGHPWFTYTPQKTCQSPMTPTNLNVQLLHWHLPNPSHLFMYVLNLSYYQMVTNLFVTSHPYFWSTCGFDGQRHPFIAVLQILSRVRSSSRPCIRSRSDQRYL